MFEVLGFFYRYFIIIHQSLPKVTTKSSEKQPPEQKVVPKSSGKLPAQEKDAKKQNRLSLSKKRKEKEAIEPYTLSQAQDIAEIWDNAKPFALTSRSQAERDSERFFAEARSLQRRTFSPF